MKFETTISFLVDYRLPQAIPYHRVARHARALAARQNDDHQEILNSASWEPPFIWVEMSSHEEVGAMSLGFFDMTGDAETPTVSTPTTPMSDISADDSSPTSTVISSIVYSAKVDGEPLASADFSTSSTVSTPSKPSPSDSFTPSLVANSPSSSSTSSLASTPYSSPSSSPVQSQRSTLAKFPSEELRTAIRSRSSSSLKRSREVMEAIQIASNTRSSAPSLASSSSW